MTLQNIALQGYEDIIILTRVNIFPICVLCVYRERYLLVVVYRRGSDSEDDEVRQAGDRDGHAGVLHGPADVLHAVSLALQVVEALHDDEHVVDADAQEQEGDDVVHGAVEEAHGRAEAVGDQNGQADATEAG